MGLYEPKFTYLVDDRRQVAWFRQPLTLTKIEYVTASTSLVTRRVAVTDDNFYQANDLIRFLKKNPCRARP